MLNRFVEKHKDSFSGVQIDHIQFDSEEVLDKTSKLLRGPVDEHAGNSETSMMLMCEPSLITVPPQDYPKHAIENAWHSDRLVDVSKDGIIDNHPTWIVSEELGKQCIQMAADELIEGLQRA